MDSSPPDHQPSSVDKRIDVGFWLLLTTISIASAWVVSLPVCSFTQQATLERFHLQSSSFAAWMVQQPSPAMYNFYNRVEISPVPWPTRPLQASYTTTINHFPVRLFTFGDNRVIFLPRQEPRTFEVRSSYRGREIQTYWVAKPLADGGFEMTDERVK